MYISGYQPIFMLLTSSLILHKFHCKPLHRTNADETSPQRHADSDGITLKAGKDKLIVLANDDEEFKSCKLFACCIYNFLDYMYSVYKMH